MAEPREMGLIIDGKGTIETVPALQPKRTIYDRATDILIQSQELQQEMEIGVREAIWDVPMDDIHRPIGILFGTDIHYGSIGTNYQLLNHHLDLVEQTPNFFMITNGDHVDNFNGALKFAGAMAENPLPPQLQMQAFMEKFRSLDTLGKVGVMSFGNHDKFMNVSGYDFFNSFCRNLNCPVFITGGILHIMAGEQHYGVALTHQYWGTSKLNPTNACKRFLDFEYPEADIAFLGHTHQSEVLTFSKGAHERIAVIGGSYKEQDMWASDKGISKHTGKPGISIVLFPDQQRMVAFKDIEDAVRFIK